MRFAILGPLDVRRPDGSQVAVGGPKVRALLRRLLFDAGRVVSVDVLVEELYGMAPPANADNALQSQVSRLRKALPGLVEFHPGGYRLATGPDDVDAHRFERLAARGRDALRDGDAVLADAVLTEALALWRGLADVPERLVELRLGVREDRAAARLSLGQADELVTELREHVAAHPLRERARALLVRALHAAGRGAEALAAFEDARRLLVEELGAQPSPELAQAHLAVLRAETPRHRPRPLPPQLTGLVGRDHELALLGDLLRECRLVTLTGPGGTGKTRLAVEAARAWPDEVCFVELAPLTDGGEVPRAVLDALGLRETALGAVHTGLPPVARLVNALTERAVLLVLDNCEHVVDAAAALVGRLLAECPPVRVLATSREALGITGEVLCPVPQLAVPPVGGDPEAVSGYPAVRLFAQRAAAVSPGFAVDTTTAATVAHICRALDGLPLAIELAAVRVRSLPVSEVAARLDDRFQLLSRGSRAAVPRHRTLHAVVEWSWDLLDEQERQLARRLTVFAASAALPDIDAVCGPDVGDVLSGLVEKSLVDLGADGRYRMLETVRAFGLERLAEAGERDRCHRAHAAHFLALSEEASPRLLAAAQLGWLRRLDADHDNLNATLRWAIRTDLPFALRLFAALVPYWWLRGRRAESAGFAVKLLGAVADGDRAVPPELVEEYTMCVLSAAFDSPDSAGLATHLAAARSMGHSVTGPPRRPFLAVLWGVTSGVPRRGSVGSPPASEAIFDPANPWCVALGRLSEAVLLRYRGEAARAQAGLRDALDGFRRVGDRWGMALTLVELGRMGVWRGDAGVLPLLAEALKLVEQLGAVEDLAELLCVRAEAHVRAGDLDRAGADFARAAELAGRAGAVEIHAVARNGISDLARLRGDLGQARTECEAALRGCPGGLFTFQAARDRIVITLGRITEAEGAVREAARLYLSAARSAVDRADLAAAASAVEGLAGVALLDGDPQRAARLLGAGTALRGVRAGGDPDVERVAAAVRADLGVAGYEQAYEAGAALSHADALALCGVAPWGTDDMPGARSAVGA